MLKPMPTGIPTKVEGDLRLEEEFGFYYCTIETPDNLDDRIKNIPVLPYREYKEGVTLYPTGKWNGWYFSEELKDAQLNYGYKIIIHKGYRFTPNTGIFDKYVYYYYNLKNNSDTTISSIAKSLLNNLYGRFGMKRDKFITKIVDKRE